ncbi:MAG: M1 family metallopeptidase [Candidatus Sulfotelmatobacter sp.]
MKNSKIPGSLVVSSLIFMALITLPLDLPAQSTASTMPAGEPVPTRDDILRGGWGPYRSNNRLLYYHLDVRVDPEKKFLSGKNTIRFRMLKDGNRIQIDLRDLFKIDKILFGTTELKYTREENSVFIDFPETLRNGKVYAIDFYYSGYPTPIGRFGSFVFDHDPAGHPWVYTACEEVGSAMWWPNKDQWHEEVKNMEISVSAPSNLVEVSNGKFMGKTDLGDGYARWDWFVHYPINAYNVSLNIGNYVHFNDHFRKQTLDFWVLPEDLDRAKKQFVQARSMMESDTHYLGEYPFIKDGYKLIQVPYSGMEHQTAVTYGNHFKNGFLERGTEIGKRFDGIIIHESGHEWFGNAVSAADRSDMWIHEGANSYLDSIYVEHMWGRADELRYVNDAKPHVKNERPVISPHDVYATPPPDQYPKSSLFLNTLRSVVDDDKKWFKLLHDYFQHFKYHNIMTEDVNAFFNQQTGMDLTPIFNQYLRHPAIPVLELKFDDARKTVSYRWKVDETAFAMPVRVGKKDGWQIIRPTTGWQSMPTSLAKADFDVATDLYYVNVDKQ